MMLNVGSAAKQGGITVDISSEKGDSGGYASGGWKSEDSKLSCGYSSFRGKRASMEDFFDVKTFKIDGQTVALFGIFDVSKGRLHILLVPARSYFDMFCLPILDLCNVFGRSPRNKLATSRCGHGGSRAAEYLKENLFENLMKHPQFVSNTKAALTETFEQTDTNFLDSERDTYRDDGSTASTAVLVGNHLYVANVGDSRTVISRAKKAIALSDDHKPNRSDERKRIENAGGVVMWAGTWRVGGVLAMSRAFGNRTLKQFVVARPEIQEQEIDEAFEVLVLASDGLWDVVSNEDVITLAHTEEEPETAARKLVDAAFTRGSADNITCIVVRFHHDKPVLAESPAHPPSIAS